ncbi:MAG: hypothetical protein U0L91_02625 [Gemmiger sp.]|uniref:hypothetical protein n=1 Tax=Gemmiger sp. TaxID=2049027 RepID=UPI002E7696EA|nr:hypothetical protein [Gemmiger sp.]MEE0800156.1 hypothetical protein [Gemmiger sp.]
MAEHPNIDISLDGVGKTTPSDRRNSRIDIPLDHAPAHRPNLGAGRILDTELEIVNRHHAEVKEMHRRARQGE